MGRVGSCMAQIRKAAKVRQSCICSVTAVYVTYGHGFAAPLR